MALLGVNDSIEIAAAVPASTTSAPQEKDSGSWFDPKEWAGGAKDILTALAVGKINKMYQLDLSNHVMSQKAPNGAIIAQGAEAAYAAANSGAIGTTLQAAGWLQKNGLLLALGVGGVVVAWMLLRK